jgi:hypothetical protein
MQEINLLQNKLKDRSESWNRTNAVVGTFLGGIVVLILAGGGFLYFLNTDAKNKIESTNADNAAIRTKLESSQGTLAEAKAFQAQLRNIEKILSSHVYWSTVFAVAEDSMINNSQYVLFQARTDGKVHVEGVVPNLTELGKLILSLSTHPDLKDVKLTSAQGNTGTAVGFRFGLDFAIKPDLLTKK